MLDASFGLPGYDAWKTAGPPESDEDENPEYGPGNPDWELDRERELDAEAFAYHLKEEQRNA